VDDQWLMGGVDNLHITCFDGNVWQETWDTTDTSTANTNLPLAVKIEIQLTGANNANGRPAPIQFLVPIDSQSRTNS